MDDVFFKLALLLKMRNYTKELKNEVSLVRTILTLYVTKNLNKRQNRNHALLIFRSLSFLFHRFCLNYYFFFKTAIMINFESSINIIAPIANPKEIKNSFIPNITGIEKISRINGNSVNVYNKLQNKTA